MVKTIFYFRHGETEWNRLGRFQGHSDIPLNQTGIDQAQGLRSFLKKCNPKVIISSDLTRAKQTARLANAELQCPHLSDPRLREVFLGLAEGKTVSEVEALWGPHLMENWINPDPGYNDFRFPGGESKIESVQRVKSFLESMIHHLAYDTIAVCGHGGTLKRFCQSITSDKTKEFLIPNCCVYQITFDIKSLVWKEHGLVF